MNKLTNRKNKIIALVVAASMMVSAIATLSVVPVNAATTRIGHACNDEHGHLSGGSAGDQTGHEVATGAWRYGGGAFGWTFVARAKNPEVSLKMAQLMKDACNNSHIGYDKSNRRSVYYAAKANNWNIAGITTNVEADCISLVCTVATAAGAPLSVNAGSRDLKQYIIRSGDFDIFTTSDYTASTKKLLPGDILCTQGKHACIVVESPNLIKFNVKYKNKTGNNKIAKIEQGKSLYLNYNNGNGIQKVVVDGNKNLKKYKSNRGSSSIKGWQKIGKDTFSAVYGSRFAAIQTSNSAVDVK